MAGFMPAIHVFLATLKQDVDGRDKPGHDDGESPHASHVHPSAAFMIEREISRHLWSPH
jgi:hypothetical protein